MSLNFIFVYSDRTITEISQPNLSLYNLRFAFEFRYFLVKCVYFLKLNFKQTKSWKNI